MPGSWRGFKMNAQFFLFACVGVLGFAIDALIFFVITSFNVELHVARILSFIAASFATWWGNRSLTFEPAQSSRFASEYFSYLLVQSIGASINFGLFALFVALFEASRNVLMTAFVVGSGAAMLFNYFSSRRWVFRSSE